MLFVVCVVLETSYVTERSCVGCPLLRRLARPISITKLVVSVAVYGLGRDGESSPPICPVHGGVLAYSSSGIFPVGNPVSVYYYLLWL